MLAMTRKILQWLQDNEAQLQDIDYADDMEESGGDHSEMMTLVYRRPDILCDDVLTLSWTGPNTIAIR